MNLQKQAGINLIAVVGPTASGKTAFAARLARAVGGEVLSADSRQVYRRMDIGTGKDLSDYLVDGTPVPVHLTDMADPGQKYSVFEYRRDFITVFRNLSEKGVMPILCGGSGMYIEAVTRGYKLIEVPRDETLRQSLSGKSLEELHNLLASLKSLHNKTDVDNPQRAIRAIEIAVYNRDHPDEAGKPDMVPFFIGVRFERDEERRRITQRLHQRLADGLVDEVIQLLASGIPAESLLYYGLEYRYVTLYLAGHMGYLEMVSRLNTAIHQFAKRQRTWFRKMERSGVNIHWINGETTPGKKLEIALSLLHEGSRQALPT